MGDQNQVPVPAPEVGQTPGQPSAAPEQQGQQTPEFITREEAQRLASEAGEQAFRRAQSLQNKGEQRVKEAITNLEGMFQAQEAAGVEIPDAVKANLRQQTESKTRQELLASEEPPTSTEPATPAAQPPVAPVPPGQSNPQSLVAWGLMQDAGVFIEDADPEVGSIDLTNVNTAVATVQQAIAAKKQRLGTPAPATPRIPTGAGTRGQTVTPDPLSMNKSELWEQAKKEF